MGFPSQFSACCIEHLTWGIPQKLLTSYKLDGLERKVLIKKPQINIGVSFRCLTPYFLTDTLLARSLGALFFVYMAKASQLARNLKKVRLVARFAEKRAALKAAGDSVGLQKLPRNSSPTRIKSRCAVTGRSRGYLRAFGLSRIKFRELAREGKIPGVKKASW